MLQRSGQLRSMCLLLWGKGCVSRFVPVSLGLLFGHTEVKGEEGR